MGGSSGINISGAIKLAKKMGPGKTIVTILCDHGKRYASKIFNKDFLKSKNYYLCQNAVKHINEEAAHNALVAMRDWNGLENLKNIINI